MRLFGWDLSLKRSEPPRDPALAALLESPNNSSGVSVSPRNAMRSAAVWACVRVLSETLASLPLQLFERMSDGSKEKATGHPLYRTLHRAPNGWQSSFEFRDQVTTHAALRGAGYAQIMVSRAGGMQIVPLNPDNVRPQLLDDGRLVYEYMSNSGRRILLQGEVLRVPYYVPDGVEPVSPIRLHAETVGLAVKSREYTGNFLRNGGRPPGYIKLDVPFKDKEARERFADALRSKIGGRAQGSTLVLEQGDYKAIGISNADAQLLDICNLSLLDICRIYRVPPHMVQALDRATWNNTEQMGIAFVTHTLGPWICRWEQALSRDLLLEDEQERYFFEFNVAGLLRGDVQTRYRAYGMGRQWGWLSVNDVRDLENMNRIESGDDYLVPTNMTTVDNIVDPNDPAGGGSNDGNGTTNPPA